MTDHAAYQTAHDMLHRNFGALNADHPLVVIDDHVAALEQELTEERSLWHCTPEDKAAADEVLLRWEKRAQAAEAALAEAKQRIAYLTAEAHGWQPRLAKAEAERDRAISLLRLVVQADRDDAKMGHPNPGDSCVSVILALHVYEYLAALAREDAL